MFIVYLNVCLHISIWIFIGAVKKVCGKFLFFNVFSDMTFSLTTSWIISDKSKNQGISEKPLKQRNFPHTFFLPCLWRFELRYQDRRWGKLYKHILIFYGIPIYFFSQQTRSWPVVDMLQNIWTFKPVLLELIDRWGNSLVNPLSASTLPSSSIKLSSWRHTE
jgi:hypothetical protein